MEAIVLDGAEIADRADQLPQWVNIILKSVFYRFREMDQKIAVLQSFGDGKKKPESEREASQATYKELNRFNKMLELTIKDLTSTEEHLIEAQTLH